MSRAWDSSGRRSLRHEEDAADTTHNKKSTRTCWMPCATGLHRVQFGIFCARISHILSSYKGDSRWDKHLLLPFSKCVLHKTANTPQFLCHVMWTGKPVFTSAVHNWHYLHAWAVNNLHNSHHSTLEQKFRIINWARITDDYIIRNYQGVIYYAEFLQETLPLLSEDVSSNTHERTWFQRDHAPPSFVCQVCNAFKNNFLDRLGVEVWSTSLLI
jgi:hypothetical protein